MENGVQLSVLSGKRFFVMEIDSSFLLKKEVIKIRFSGDEFGTVGLMRQAKIGDFVVCSRGIALEIKEASKTRSLGFDEWHWFRYRARDLGFFADKVGLSDELICQAASENPDMVLRSWEEIESEWTHRFDFKRAKRPFVSFQGYEGPCWGIVWEFYSALARIGVYSSGHVRFYDRAEFRIL